MTPAVWASLAVVAFSGAVSIGILINRLGNLETAFKEWTNSRESQGKRMGEFEREIAELRGEVRTLRDILGLHPFRGAPVRRKTVPGTKVDE